MSCRPEDHAKITASPRRFLVELELHAERQADGLGGELTLAHCRECNSTLAMDTDVIRMFNATETALACLDAGNIDSAVEAVRLAREASERIERRAEWRRREEEAA